MGSRRPAGPAVSDRAAGRRLALAVALLPSLTLLASPAARGANLLEASPLLKKLGLRLEAAEVRGKTILIRPQPAGDARTPVYLLGSDGEIHRLRGNPSTPRSRLTWGCVQDEAAAKLKRFSRGPVRGRFVALGAGADQRLRWFPARRLGARSLPECLAYRDDYKLAAGMVFKVGAISRSITFSDWSFVARDAQKRCRDWAADVVGTYDPKARSCQVLHAQRRDCDGGTDGPSARGLVGALRIQGASPEERETWLVFQAQRGSSPGYSFLQVTPDGDPAGKPLLETHPWGCP